MFHVLDECPLYAAQREIWKRDAMDVMESDSLAARLDERMAWSLARFVKEAAIRI